MKKILLINAIIFLCTCPSFAQHAAKHKVVKNNTIKTTVRTDVDLTPSRGIIDNSYAYYNTEKGGYVFYDNGRESFLPALPVIPDTYTPAKTSVPLSKKLDLDLYPQLHYPNNQLVHPDRNSN